MLCGFHFIQRPAPITGWNALEHWNVCGEVLVTWYWYGSSFCFFHVHKHDENLNVELLLSAAAGGGGGGGGIKPCFFLLCSPVLTDSTSRHVSVLPTVLFFFRLVPRLLHQSHSPAAKSPHAGIIAPPPPPPPLPNIAARKLSFTHPGETNMAALCLTSHPYRLTAHPFSFQRRIRL